MSSILIIDDNAVNRYLAATMVKHCGCEPLEAADAAEGIARAQHDMPDLILLDLFLPDISGLEVLHKLKSDESTRAIPVVCITTSALPVHETGMREGGCVEYLTKPLRPVDLIKVIQTHVPQLPG